MSFANPIGGETYIDDRGKIKFFNSFDMKEIVRFYEIAPASISTIRAWQGHHKEKKWFFCTAGTFVVNLKRINDASSKPKELVVQRFELSENNPMILEVPGGFATGFKSVAENSKLMVFSNFSLEESKNDDLRFPLEQWEAEW